MQIFGIILLCIICYSIGYQKGKNPRFFQEFKQKKSQPTRKKERKSVEKIVSIVQYKEKNKRSGR